jgi:hypothetical protein
MGIRVDGLRDGCYQFECSRCRRICCRFFGFPRAKSRGFPSPSGVGVSDRFQEVFLKRLRWTAAALLVSALFSLNSCSSGTGNIPTPSIGSISPDSITAGSADFTLFVSGTGLEANTVGFLDGTSRPSKFNKTTGQVEMSITAADVAVPDASVQVTVANPSPGGASNALTLVVNPVANGAPTITGFNPPSATAGTMGPFTVSVAGTGFVQTSVVNWDGSPRATTFVSASQLTVNFTTQDLATAGSGSVSVSNPAPGGGVSPSKNFPVN